MIAVYKASGSLDQAFEWSWTHSDLQCPRGGHAQCWPKNIKFLKYFKNHACRCSTCRYGSPEHGDIIFVGIGRKIAGLWAKSNVKKDQIMDINSYSPGQISMFFKWNNLFMKDRPKLCIKSNEYLNICTRNLHHKQDEWTNLNDIWIWLIFRVSFYFYSHLWWWLVELESMQGRHKMDGLWTKLQCFIWEGVSRMKCFKMLENFG